MTKQEVLKELRIARFWYWIGIYLPFAEMFINIFSYKPNTSSGLCNYFRIRHSRSRFVKMYLVDFAPKALRECRSTAFLGITGIAWFPMTRKGDKQRLEILREAYEYYKYFGIE